nr:hypothetical protein [uncultured Dysosmobacter sp.]
MTGFIVAREEKCGNWSMMKTSADKVAVFPTADEAWAKVFEIARDQGIVRPTRLYELADCSELVKHSNSPYVV